MEYYLGMAQEMIVGKYVRGLEGAPAMARWRGQYVRVPSWEERLQEMERVVRGLVERVERMQGEGKENLIW